MEIFVAIMAIGVTVYFFAKRMSGNRAASGGKIGGVRAQDKTEAE